jgi:hypothetical protein
MHFLDLLDQEIAAQERALEAHPAYVKLRALRATRALYAGGEGREMIASTASYDAPMRDASRRRSAPPMAGKSLEAVKAVVEVLTAQRKPMRTAELLPHIIERGIVFNGDAPQNILSSLLSRSDDVVSKGGHIGWALASWDSEGGTSAASVSPPSDVQPHSGPVEPGQEVEDDNIAL